jgi:hypothetical protein
MLHNRLILFFLIFLIPFCAKGQEKYTLSGHLHVKDGDTYPYRLVFDVAKGNIAGYSYTKSPDGTETKAVIKGHLNRKKQTLTITETQALAEHKQDVYCCLIDARMMYKVKGDDIYVIGAFTGKSDDSGKNCGRGLVQFQQPNTPTSVFYTDTATGKPAPQNQTETETLAKNQLPERESTITAGQQKQYEWTTDTCVLDIWDAGVIDGDVVSVLVNEKTVLANYTLAKGKKQLKIALTQKSNTITIVAEDEGVNPPNTAEILLSDGDVHYKITAFNKKGEKASVVIRKK